ncbi:MAG: hypothetical protein H6737_14730 [Alphaproteobacteria bacterium]|nr:hypothetical protein [Alphaproteobacteria bacterium]
MSAFVTIAVSIGTAVAVGLYFMLPRGPRPADDAAPPRPAAPSGPATRTTTVWIRIGDQAFVADAHVHLDTEEGVHLRCRLTGDDGAPDGDGLELHADAGGETATLRIGGMEGHLCDPFEQGVLSVEADGVVQIHGLQGSFSFPHHGPFRRMRDVFVGFPDAPDLGGFLAGTFAPEAVDADGVIPWTLDGATRYAVRALGDMPTISAIEVVEPGVILMLRDGGELRMDLHNIFADMRQSPPDEGREMLDRFLRNMAMPVSSATGRDQLAIRVYPGAAPLTLQAGPDVQVTFASIALAEDLAAVFVQDTPDTMRPLQEPELEALVPEVEERLPLARENLLRSLPHLHIRGEGGMYMLLAGGNYEASLVLLPELWEAMEPLIEGPPLVALPARDLLFVTGDTGPEAVARLAALCRDMEELSYAISDGVYRVDGMRLERIG